ncbi:hypothetical protein DMH27_14220 [Raoultella planticola]|nr:hypothetical protein [Raoultella planticola]
MADEGGPRDLPPVKGDAALSVHIGASLMADEFDMSFFMNKSSTTACSLRSRRCCRGSRTRDGRRG